MFWRRKNSKKQRTKEGLDDGRQVWTHNPNSLGPIFGQGPDVGPVTGDDEGKEKVYTDEIDPDWADPDTAE
jgi:hypothetical protein